MILNTFLKKDVSGIIRSNYHIFEYIDELEEICIYGWSFSSVDLPYLKHIIDINSDISRIKWEISYYREEDKEIAMKFLKKYNTLESQISFVKLNELLCYVQQTLF